MTRFAPGAFLCIATGCELREITIATPEDIVVAEIVLRAGSSVQTAYLHRTATGSGSARVYGAHIEITDAASGRTFEMDVVADGLCLDPDPPPDLPSVGTCYAAELSPGFVRGGQTYSVRIEVPGGSVITGVTTVPSDFQLVRPSGGDCRIAPDSTYELVWTRSAGASVYLVEAELRGLQAALRLRGVELPGNDPVDLLGLAITQADTMLVFPSELGLFDRFDDDVHPILLAIRGGLPPDVSAEVSVVATDRNYVNWIRGGNFNPSGQVRISSLRGDGIGVFGSIVARSATIRSLDQAAPPPPCM